MYCISFFLTNSNEIQANNLNSNKIQNSLHLTVVPPRVRPLPKCALHYSVLLNYDIVVMKNQRGYPNFFLRMVNERGWMEAGAF